MYLHIYFKVLVKIKEEDKKKLDKFTLSLYNGYKDDEDIEKILSQIINLKNIPIELLCKYWLRVYTAKSFHFKMNNCLNSRKTREYSLFIKMMYEGVKIKALESPIKKYIYRGAHMEKTEINNIKECLNNKENNITTGILFCRAFLSFSCSKKVAVKFALRDDYYNPKTMKRVLFELISDENVVESFNTHADIKKYSIYKGEEEILFFPFSCFEIIGFGEKYEQGENLVFIKLIYISHNDSRLRNNDTINTKEAEDILIESKLKKEIKDSNIINQDELENSSKSSIIKNTNHYIQEENDLIENAQSIHQQKLSEIMNQISEDTISSKEEFNISGENQSEIQVNKEYEEEHYINHEVKKSNLGKILIIALIVILILAAIIFPVVFTRKKNKNKEKQIDVNINRDIEIINSDEIKDSYFNGNANIIKKTDINENENIIDESYLNRKSNIIEKTNINGDKYTIDKSYMKEGSNIIKKSNINENEYSIKESYIKDGPNIIINTYNNENEYTIDKSYSNQNSDIIKNTYNDEDFNLSHYSYKNEKLNTINTAINNKIDNSNIIIINTQIIQPSEIIKNPEENTVSNIVISYDDLYPYIDETSEEYQIALIELEEMNNYRKQLGLKELTPDLYLINLVYDDILEILYTGNITIGGIKNDKGENLGQYMLLRFSNNTLTLGYATERWYKTRKDSFDEDDCFISDKTTNYGFGAICFSNGCIAIAYFYPCDSGTGYGLVD